MKHTKAKLEMNFLKKKQVVRKVLNLASAMKLHLLVLSIDILHTVIVHIALLANRIN